MCVKVFALNRIAAGIKIFPVAVPFIVGCDFHVRECPFKQVVFTVIMLPLQCFVLVAIMFPHC